MKRPTTAEACRIALDAAGGNATRAARALGIERAELVALLGIEEKKRGPKPRRLDPRKVAAAVKGRSLREAAALLGIPHTTLADHLNRAKDTSDKGDK